MSTIPQVATTLQTVLGPDLEPIGRRTGLIQRLRKFSAEILLKTLVFTLLKCPSPKTKNYVSSAAQLGLIITERALKKRFTPRLVTFLRTVLERLMQHLVASTPVDTPLLAKFTSVRVGDSTTVMLPADCAREFPGCGGKAGSGTAALKIQVLWDLTTGRLLKVLLEPGRHSDAKSAAVEETPPAGSLSLWDLGYFCLKRFRQWTAAGAFWISRWPPGTVVLTPEGTPLDLLPRLRRHPWDGPLDIAVLLGSTARVACRLLALRVPPEVAARRRQKADEKAQKSGRTPTRAPAVVRLDDLGDQLLDGVVDLERGRGPVPHPVADRTVVQTLEVAQPAGDPRGVPERGLADGGILGETDWSDPSTLVAPDDDLGRLPAQLEKSRRSAARLDHRAAGSAGRCRSALRRLKPNASRDRGRGPGQCPEEKAELVPTP